MNRRIIVRGALAAVVMPLAVVALYIAVSVMLTLIGVGPGAAFARDMSLGNADAVRSAKALVDVTRMLTLPLIVVVVALATARIDSAGAGTFTEAAVASIIGGYPSWVAVAALVGVYVVLALSVRAMIRRRKVARTQKE